MSKNKIGEDSPIPKFIYLKIRRRDGVKSLTTLEEGEFKVPIDGCIRGKCIVQAPTLKRACIDLSNFTTKKRFSSENCAGSIKKCK